ncbi:alpha-2,3-sialyltransferase [Campylobacter insulaenigrae]|uniref:Alpha-2,3-sialyltransferase n=1 Tax=Campylobacter insulaenigrae NCTC 12927 TaxID=1031564 RepID=A0A0A8H3A8_9BACT|nr:alpha-2,3-sialyltransferase [Campylobacter insulaenigrae]AJC88165.1 alpha-2,3-sialyltransferase [Campylobacter insulaenigrae NCTC 12927]VEH95109.1 Alpha-2,3-sialyltransferase (CST-I) [Campylobacter insulaenigrae]
MEEKNALICGNGPSLREIEYEKLPKNYDVFRCNQFYFEDKYYAGKNIQYAFFNPYVFFEQYYTIKNIIDKDEYDIKNIVCSSFGLESIDSRNLLEFFYNYFPDTIFGFDLIKQLKEFHSFIKFNEIYNEQRITSGIYMCAFAVAMGYKNIYISGIDFYSNKNQPYLFKYQTNNVLKLIPEFKNEIKATIHSKNFDLKALEFLSKTYNVNFYSLNQNSELSKYIKLASIIRGNNDFVIDNKPKDYIDDILLPANNTYKKFKKFPLPVIKNNLWFRLIKDLVRLPSDIKHYLKDKR